MIRILDFSQISRDEIFSRVEDDIAKQNGKTHYV